MKKFLYYAILLSLTLSVLLPLYAPLVSAESYVSQSAAGERKIYEGIPDGWETKAGYSGFYTKYVMVYGIPAMSTDDVADWILFRAYDVMEVYLRKIYYEYPEIIDSLIKNRSNVIVIGAHEYNIEHPDWTAYEQSLGAAGKTERRGGGSRETTVLVDDLGIKDPNNWFSDFCGLVHEFTHTVLGYGIGDADHSAARPDIFKKINDAYEAAYKAYKADGKYKESVYDMNNYHEYFAGQVGRWFNGNGTNLKVMGAARKTERQQLAEYDPAIYEVCEMLFGEYALVEPWGDGSDSKIDENEVIVDYSPLADAVAYAKSFKESMLDSGWDELQAALTEAQTALYSGSLTEADVNKAADKLISALSAVVPADGNLAYLASASTTFVSSWESLSAVNDGEWGKTSAATTCSHYGTWGNLSASESVTYEWTVPVKINSSDLYIWTDNYTTNSNIAIPKSYIYEYRGDDGEWHEVTGADNYDVLRVREDGGKANLDGFNLTAFDEITTTAIRVTLNKNSKADYGVGIVEWRVYGSIASSAPASDDTADTADTESTDPAGSADSGSEDEPDKSGCGSAASGIGVIAALTLSGAAVIRRKRDNKA